ncbi:hypothetical protein SKAU_G00272490 [Synaphobranchus kaupii]|uniref:Secreted protein n=1 Tax=Synaphobranchus kaupii TaxID=118154 RepID=A0A9Q1IPT5_SYNKA|nr:hypothetical protein SKAU_G00272490 [Synaphobranchus kaupii]
MWYSLLRVTCSSSSSLALTGMWLFGQQGWEGWRWGALAHRGTGSRQGSVTGQAWRSHREPAFRVGITGQSGSAARPHHSAAHCDLYRHIR